MMVPQRSQLQQGGGIIINRSDVLLRAINDPCIYNYLSDDAKEHVETLNQKGSLKCTQEDVAWMGEMIRDTVKC